MTFNCCSAGIGNYPRDNQADIENGASLPKATVSSKEGISDIRLNRHLFCRLGGHSLSLGVLWGILYSHLEHSIYNLL
jgi:hypothetical protein